ncbi:MAG TPA: flagellar biosynthetic protein FliO [Solirubrobacteraceae bacterium]|nr:flagellar biosynthetic protein FliO [Solirubrobacteraceae bacterium]
MTRLIPLSRAVATATAALGACLLACASTAAAFTPALKTGGASGGENTPLSLTTSTGTAHSTSSSGGASIVRTIVGLAIVIAVIWGLAWILRQVKAGRDPHISSDGLASIAALTLGTGRSVHLVRAGSDYVLLGSTEHGVAPIHRYTEEDAREAGLLFEERPPERSRLIGAAGQLIAGTGRASSREPAAWLQEQTAHSPVVGPRPDPMRMRTPSSNVIDRLRELTVRR